MKRFLFVFLILFTDDTLLAQSNDTITAVITYAFSHVRSTAERNKPYTENMDLFLSRNSSCYKSADRIKNDSIMIANFEATGVMNFIPYSKEEMFLNFADHKFFVENDLVNKYLVEHDWPVIKWIITNETSTISSLKCQKAVGEWRGRTYTAWFCSELSYQAGPWKLNGLPGLIIEAYDENREVEFKFAGFRSINGGKETIVLPVDDIKATVKEYNQMMAAFQRDRAGFINASAGRQVVSGSKTNPSSQPSRSKDNPMELSED